MNAEPKWINEHQVALMTGISLSTLRRDRHRHQGLSYYKVGKSVRYLVSDVVGFMDLHRINVDPSEETGR